MKLQDLKHDDNPTHLSGSFTRVVGRQKELTFTIPVKMIQDKIVNRGGTNMKIRTIHSVLPDGVNGRGMSFSFNVFFFENGDTYSSNRNSFTYFYPTISN